MIKQKVKGAYNERVREDSACFGWFGTAKSVVSDHWGRIHRRNKRIFCDNVVWSSLVSGCRSLQQNRYRVSRWLCHNILCRCCRCFCHACCYNRCCVCLSRVPYDSLVAFFFLALGAGSFGYFLLEAVTGAMDLINAFLETEPGAEPALASVAPFAQLGVMAIAGGIGNFALFVLIIGIAATGPTRRQCCGRYGCRLYGRIIVAFMVVSSYFLVFFWMLFFGLLMIPTILTLIVDQACALDIVKEIKQRCLDMTKLNELLGAGTVLATNTLSELIAIRSIGQATSAATGLLTDVREYERQVRQSLISRADSETYEGEVICADELYKLCKHGTGLWMGFAIACGASMIIVVGLFHTLPVLTANYAHIHDTPDRKRKNKKRRKVKAYSREKAAMTTEEKYVIIEDMDGSKKAVKEEDYGKKTGLEVLEKHREYPEYRHFNYPQYRKRDHPPFVPVPYVIVEYDEGSSVSGDSYFTSVDNIDRFNIDSQEV
ncbi:uncharacterized protein LOC144439111 [Glandiceps talaboti]